MTDIRVHMNTELMENIMRKYPPPTKNKPVKKHRKRNVVRNIFTDQDARLEWINNLTEEETEEILQEEQITLSQLKYRLRKNPNYDIGSYWDKNCHIKYGHLNENARTAQFIKEMEFFMIPLPENGYSQRERQMFKRIREKADELKASYTDYVAAIYKCFGEKQMSYSRLNFKKYREVYERWVKNGRNYPKPKPLLELIKRREVGRRKDDNR